MIGVTGQAGTKPVELSISCSVHVKTSLLELPRFHVTPGGCGSLPSSPHKSRLLCPASAGDLNGRIREDQGWKGPQKTSGTVALGFRECYRALEKAGHLPKIAQLVNREDTSGTQFIRGSRCVSPVAWDVW